MLLKGAQHTILNLFRMRVVRKDQRGKQPRRAQSLAFNFQPRLFWNYGQSERKSVLIVHTVSQSAAAICTS